MNHQNNTTMKPTNKNNMTPKEKAKEIWDKMIYHIMYNCQPTLSEMVAKECALIAVGEIFNSKLLMLVEDEIFWREVKQEIEKL